MSRSDRNRDSGSTLVETIIVVVVLVVLSGIVVQSILGLARTQRVTERRAETLAVAERAMQGVVLDVARAFRIYTNDVAGKELLAILSFDSETPLSGGRLPVVTTRGVFEPDPVGVFETGNLLLLGTARGPQEVTFGSGSGSVARIDVLQVVLHHLSRVDGRIELNRWASVRLARADDLAAVTDPDDRAAIVRVLFAEGVRYAWRPDVRVGRGFFVLEANGQVGPVGYGFRLPRSPTDSRLRMLGRRGVSVAENGSIPNVHVPALGQVLGDYPHGFEVKIDGDGAGQLVLARLTLTFRRSDADDLVHSEVERLVPHRGER